MSFYYTRTGGERAQPAGVRRAAGVRGAGAALLARARARAPVPLRAPPALRHARAAHPPS